MAHKSSHFLCKETPQVCFIEIIFRIITLTIYYAEVRLGIHMDGPCKGQVTGFRSGFDVRR